MSGLAWALWIFFSLPLTQFSLLGAPLLWGHKYSEKVVNRLSAIMTTATLLVSLLLLYLFFLGKSEGQVVHLARLPWFDLSFCLEYQALIFNCLITAIAALIGCFSSSYLHRDPGFYRFFVLF